MAIRQALEDRGDYGNSFAHYLAGNSQRRATVSYDADENHERVQRAKRLLSSSGCRRSKS